MFYTKKLLQAGLFLLSSLPISALASPLESVDSMMGTWSAGFEPYFRDGELVGCSVVFRAAQRDYAYRQGEVVVIDGNVTLMMVKKAFGVTLKVVLNDMDGQTGGLSPSAPASAYLISGLETSKNATVDKMLSDTPGGIFVIFKAEQTLPILLESLSKDELLISYSRIEGGTDAQFKIDTSVVKVTPDGKSIKSRDTEDNFLACSKKLVETAQ